MYELNSKPLPVGKLYKARLEDCPRLQGLSLLGRSAIFRMSYDDRIRLLENNSMLLFEVSIRDGRVPPHCGYIDYNFLIGKYQIMFACQNNPLSRREFNNMVIPIDHWCKVYGT